MVSPLEIVRRQCGLVSVVANIPESRVELTGDPDQLTDAVRRVQWLLRLSEIVTAVVPCDRVLMTFLMKSRERGSGGPTILDEIIEGTGCWDPAVDEKDECIRLTGNPSQVEEAVTRLLSELELLEDRLRRIPLRRKEYLEALRQSLPSIRAECGCRIIVDPRRLEAAFHGPGPNVEAAVAQVQELIQAREEELRARQRPGRMARGLRSEDPSPRWHERTSSADVQG
eukprot:RCo048826